MGALKSEIYRDDLIEFTELLKALAHPARLRILEIMMEKTDGWVSTNDFILELQLSQSAISQHIKVLTSAGIIATRSAIINGRFCQCYEFDYDTIETITIVLNKMLSVTLDKKSKEFEIINKFYSKFKVVLVRRWKQVKHPMIV